MASGISRTFRPGGEFDHYIAEQMGACDVLIALIGPDKAFARKMYPR